MMLTKPSRNLNLLLTTDVLEWHKQEGLTYGHLVETWHQHQYHQNKVTEKLGSPKITYHQTVSIQKRELVC